jgi:hypothetical protein
MWHLERFLQCFKYIILGFTPSTALLYSPPPIIPRIVSTGIIFAFTYMCTHFLHGIYPPTPFPHHLPPPTGTNIPHPLGRTCSALLLSDFVEEKIKNK